MARRDRRGALRALLFLVASAALACATPAPPEPVPDETTAGAEDGLGPSDGGPTEVATEAPTRREPVPCGELTCGPDEACVITCLCCGVRIPDPSEARARYECVPLAPECLPPDAPAAECPRLVERPCA